MRTASLVTLLLTLVGGAAYATEYLQTLKEGSWVCGTPEAYDVAVALGLVPRPDESDRFQRLLRLRDGSGGSVTQREAA